MEDLAPGTLLIADPFLKDPNFTRTVILVCEHQDTGSLGFVLNKRLEYTLEDLIPDAEGLDLPIYFGGPVQTDTLHFLHCYPGLIPGSKQLGDGMSWGGHFETALSLIRDGEIDPTRIRFYLGYSGWSEGQLDGELKGKSWLTAGATPRVVFHRNLGETWKESIRLLGGEYEMMANFPIDPQLN
jgi:putative transcriptional regulator